MAFSMCNCKKVLSQSVIQPTHSSSTSTIPSSSPSSSSRKSKKSRPSSSTSTTFSIPSSLSTSTFFPHSSSSSSFSPTTPSLRSISYSLLPDRPNIYDIFEISTATNRFLLKPHFSSSSTAWLCKLCHHHNLNRLPAQIPP